MTFLLTACLCLLSADDFETREAAEALLSVAGDRTAVLAVRLTAESPEARERAALVWARLVPRDVDAAAAAAGGYPPADTVRGWVPGDGLMPKGHPREFWYLPIPYQMYWDHMPVPPSPDEQSARTREALVDYLRRTGDWKAVETVLAPRR